MEQRTRILHHVRSKKPIILPPNSGVVNKSRRSAPPSNRPNRPSGHNQAASPCNRRQQQKAPLASLDTDSDASVTASSRQLLRPKSRDRKSSRSSSSSNRRHEQGSQRIVSMDFLKSDQISDWSQSEWSDDEADGDSNARRTRSVPVRRQTMDSSCFPPRGGDDQDDEECYSSTDTLSLSSSLSSSALSLRRVSPNNPPPHAVRDREGTSTLPRRREKDNVTHRDEQTSNCNSLPMRRKGDPVKQRDGQTMHYNSLPRRREEEPVKQRDGWDRLPMRRDEEPIKRPDGQMSNSNTLTRKREEEPVKQRDGQTMNYNSLPRRREEEPVKQRDGQATSYNSLPRRREEEPVKHRDEQHMYNCNTLPRRREEEQASQRGGDKRDSTLNFTSTSNNVNTHLNRNDYAPRLPNGIASSESPSDDTKRYINVPSPQDNNDNHNGRSSRQFDPHGSLVSAISAQNKSSMRSSSFHQSPPSSALSTPTQSRSSFSLPLQKNTRAIPTTLSSPLAANGNSITSPMSSIGRSEYSSTFSTTHQRTTVPHSHISPQPSSPSSSSSNSFVSPPTSPSVISTSASGATSGVTSVPQSPLQQHTCASSPFSRDAPNNCSWRTDPRRQPFQVNYNQFDLSPEKEKPRQLAVSPVSPQPNVSPPTCTATTSRLSSASSSSSPSSQSSPPSSSRAPSFPSNPLPSSYSGTRAAPHCVDSVYGENSVYGANSVHGANYDTHSTSLSRDHTTQQSLDKTVIPPSNYRVNSGNTFDKTSSSREPCQQLSRTPLPPPSSPSSNQCLENGDHHQPAFKNSQPQTGTEFSSQKRANTSPRQSMSRQRHDSPNTSFDHGFQGNEFSRQEKLQKANSSPRQSMSRRHDSPNTSFDRGSQGNEFSRQEKANSSPRQSISRQRHDSPNTSFDHGFQFFLHGQEIRASPSPSNTPNSVRKNHSHFPAFSQEPVAVGRVGDNSHLFNDKSNNKSSNQAPRPVSTSNSNAQFKSPSNQRTNSLGSNYDCRLSRNRDSFRIATGCDFDLLDDRKQPEEGTSTSVEEAANKVDGRQNHTPFHPRAEAYRQTTGSRGMSPAAYAHTPANHPGVFSGEGYREGSGTYPVRSVDDYYINNPNSANTSFDKGEPPSSEIENLPPEPFARGSRQRDSYRLATSHSDPDLTSIGPGDEIFTGRDNMQVSNGVRAVPNHIPKAGFRNDNLSSSGLRTPGYEISNNGLTSLVQQQTKQPSPSHHANSYLDTSFSSNTGSLSRIKRNSLRLATASLSDLSVILDEIDIGEDPDPPTNEIPQEPVPSHHNSPHLSHNGYKLSPLMERSLERSGSSVSSRNSSFGSFYSCQSMGRPSAKNSPNHTSSSHSSPIFRKQPHVGGTPESVHKLIITSNAAHDSGISQSSEDASSCRISANTSIASSNDDVEAYHSYNGGNGIINQVPLTGSLNRYNYKRPTFYWTRQSPYPRHAHSTIPASWKPREVSPSKPSIHNYNRSAPRYPKAGSMRSYGSASSVESRSSSGGGGHGGNVNNIRVKTSPKRLPPHSGGQILQRYGCGLDGKNMLCRKGSEDSLSHRPMPAPRQQNQQQNPYGRGRPPSQGEGNRDNCALPIPPNSRYRPGVNGSGNHDTDIENHRRYDKYEYDSDNKAAPAVDPDSSLYLDPDSDLEYPDGDGDGMPRSPPSLGRPRRKMYAGFDSQPLPMDSLMSDSSSVYTGASCSSRATDVSGQPDSGTFDESFYSIENMSSVYGGVALEAASLPPEGFINLSEISANAHLKEVYRSGSLYSTSTAKEGDGDEMSDADVDAGGHGDPMTPMNAYPLPQSHHSVWQAQGYPQGVASLPVTFSI